MGENQWASVIVSSIPKTNTASKPIPITALDEVCICESNAISIAVETPGRIEHKPIPAYSIIWFKSLIFPKKNIPISNERTILKKTTDTIFNTMNKSFPYSSVSRSTPVSSENFIVPFSRSKENRWTVLVTMKIKKNMLQLIKESII